MLEKIIIGLLKAMSGVIYVATLLVLLSIPVIFIVYAIEPPEFTFESAVIDTVSDDDEHIASLGGSSENWYRADYRIKAGSGKLSPYYYKIDKFVEKNNPYIDEAEDYRIFIDRPLYFTNKDIEEFVLSFYIKCDSPETAAKIADAADFKAADFEKGFGKFYVIYR